MPGHFGSSAKLNLSDIQRSANSHLYSMKHFREDLEESDERGEVPFLTDDEFLQKYRMSQES